MIEPVYQREGITLYHGDCLDILPQLEAGSVDAVVTDPPYGLGVKYESYNDSVENLEAIAADLLPELKRVACVVAMTCGVANIQRWPNPSWTLCWACSGAGSRGKYGFSCWQPILAWGKDPYLTRRMGARPDLIYQNAASEKFDHPCPKPLAVWRKVVERFSPHTSDLILDPFMGSGTTGVVCVETGRNFIGIELERKYVDIAIGRIEKAFSEKAEMLPMGGVA